MGSAQSTAGKAAAERRAGFTLLEILVVIVVMALLMGITFRLVKPTESIRSTASTLKRLQLLNAAIAEYHAEYGIYPPAVACTHDNVKGNWGLWPIANSLHHHYCTDNKNKDQYDVGSFVGHTMPYSISKKNVKFAFGLMSFLIDRRISEEKFRAIYSGSGTREFFEYFGKGYWYDNSKGLPKDGLIGSADGVYKLLAPSDRDANFFKRVKPMLDDLAKEMSGKEYASPNGLERFKSTSFDRPLESILYYSAWDSWGNDFIYISPPPHTSYALFSAGPDGKIVTTDPLNREAKCACGAYHNRDNIYAAVDDRK